MHQHTHRLKTEKKNDVFWSVKEDLMVIGRGEEAVEGYLELRAASSPDLPKTR
jgi:hypothetical protein